ncbi:MAG: helix-turn-helix transcriptional regulator, partial [Clostridia bacterium]|nr:helix-turn-helix transcriptional regulator [Clostridia bacterium]
ERLPFELFLGVAAGTVTLLVCDRETTLNAGEVALVPYDTAFSVTVGGGAELIWVGADYRVFTNLRIFSVFELPQRLEERTPVSLGTCRSVRDLVNDNQFTNYRLENAMEINLLLYHLALAVIRKSMPKKESNMVMSRFERLAPVLSHIGEHLDKSCPIGVLSEIMELSEDSFYRYFKSTIGSSPKEYLISERLRRARILLVSSQMSVTDISKRCGYENPFYFSTLFHGKYGMSPTAYREKTTALMELFG